MQLKFEALLAVCVFSTPIFALHEDKLPPKPSLPEEAPPKNPLSRGWNDDIAWVSFEDGLKLAKEQNKPLFVLIHKTWCHACQSLKKNFAKAKSIQDLSKNFIMVNCEDDEEPWEEDYAPNGGKYIPRLLFVDPNGEVLKDVKNPKMEFEQYPYYYSNPAPIITAMRQVMFKYNLKEEPAETKGKTSEAASEEVKKAEEKVVMESENKKEKVHVKKEL